MKPNLLELGSCGVIFQFVGDKFCSFVTLEALFVSEFLITLNRKGNFFNKTRSLLSRCNL